jgi:hypothetical protein
MAIQILNLSTDAIDFQPFHTTNLSEFNDLNSIVEYLTEVVLNYKNAFPESADQQSTSSKAQFEKHGNIKLFIPDVLTLLQKREEPQIDHVAPAIDPYRYLFFKEINPPPPKC